ncbi:zinc finger protein 391-like [Cloeon dipterum]|uniref:zinc finger protein 391-like n=1 Tax=Cloeon dipterum TaxID=197152 RepID=UPI0032205EBD
MMWDEPMFEAVCRLCAGSEDVCIPIFSKDGDTRLSEKIKRCLPMISVSQADEKPKQLCYHCLSKLELCFELVECSLASDYKFDSIIHSQNGNFMCTEATQKLMMPVLQDEEDKNIPMQAMPTALEVSSLIEQDNMWTLMREAAEELQNPASQNSLGNVSPSPLEQHQQAQATVTLEHVALHSDQIQSDRLIVLGKVEAREDSRGNELGLVNGRNAPDGCADILLMVELKYKDLLGGEANGKVPTITYTSQTSAVLNPIKITQDQEEEETVVELVSPDQSTDALVSAHLAHPIDQSVSEGIKYQQKAPKAKPQEKFPCDICKKLFVRRANLKVHMAAHSDIRPFSCDICAQRFPSQWAVTLHKRLHSGDFCCEFCGKKFSVKGKLERHRRIHTGEKPFVCPKCSKAFSDKRNLQSHMRCHTDERPYSCDVCHKAFRAKSHLIDHNRVHTIDKPFICHICGKSFKWKPTLNLHLKCHAGEVFTCNTCGKNFSRRTDLKKHVLCHTLDRPFKCDECDKGFKDSKSLRKHVKNHADGAVAGLHKCVKCEKSFRSRWHLQNHFASHYKMPFHCEVCGEYFESKPNFVYHLKSHDMQEFAVKENNATTSMVNL